MRVCLRPPCCTGGVDNLPVRALEQRPAAVAGALMSAPHYAYPDTKILLISYIWSTLVCMQYYCRIPRLGDNRIGKKRSATMGLSVPVSSVPPGDPVAQKHKEKTLDMFLDPRSLLFVFLRACRWCWAAAVLQLVVSRLWFNPAARNRSSWIPAYPIQVFGVVVALVLAARCVIVLHIGCRRLVLSRILRLLPTGCKDSFMLQVRIYAA